MNGAEAMRVEPFRPMGGTVRPEWVEPFNPGGLNRFALWVEPFNPLIFGGAP